MKNFEIVIYKKTFLGEIFHREINVSIRTDFKLEDHIDNKYINNNKYRIEIIRS